MLLKGAHSPQDKHVLAGVAFDFQAHDIHATKPVHGQRQGQNNGPVAPIDRAIGRCFGESCVKQL